MRKASTAISELKIRGVTRYRVTYPTATGRKRELYVDRKKAERRLKEVKDEQKRFGQSVTAMTSTTRADATAAEKLLTDSGITLVEAARFILAEKKREQSGVPITEAVEAFLQSRGDRSADYLNTLRPRLEYIANFFAGRTTAGIKANDCQRLLDGLAGTQSQRTVSHYRTHLSVFLKFCESREWITGNPAKRTTSVKVPGQETAILTPQEAATLLSACHRDILPGVIIATFCGLRNAEIERLDWKAVSLAQGIITIGAGVAKTNSRRVVSIPDNASRLRSIHRNIKRRQGCHDRPGHRESPQGFEAVACKRAAAFFHFLPRGTRKESGESCLRSGQFARHCPTALQRLGESAGRKVVLRHHADRGRKGHLRSVQQSRIIQLTAEKAEGLQRSRSQSVIMN